MRETLVAHEMSRRIADVPRLHTFGRVARIVGLAIEVSGLEMGLGELARITNTHDARSVLAEVVGFHQNGCLLMPLGELDGIAPGASVVALGRSFGVDVGPGLLGRILNGLGHPIDDKGKLDVEERAPLQAEPPNPLHREVISRTMPTGVRAIDGLLTIGQGQRIGIFAGSGVGKSTLLGERGREVRDFVEHSLGEEGLKRSVIIVATGDQAALIRARGALVATAIAEYFRDQGKQVLLMVDSITRVAMAWREIGLAVGEPPTTKGYPPSVFAALPRLLERAGNARSGGITGVYSVLVDGDDFNEPIADAARSILDGHIVLTRKLASAGHFPAIDVLDSKSRVRDLLITDAHKQAANLLLQLEAAWREKEDLILVGAYQKGSDPLVDAAIALRDSLLAFLRQPPNESTPIDDAVNRLRQLQARYDHLMQQRSAA